jgi:hypothetical protein
MFHSAFSFIHLGSLCMSNKFLEKDNKVFGFFFVLNLNTDDLVTLLIFSMTSFYQKETLVSGK